MSIYLDGDGDGEWSGFSVAGAQVPIQQAVASSVVVDGQDDECTRGKDVRRMVVAAVVQWGWSEGRKNN